jgi:hypothetical protein
MVPVVAALLFGGMACAEATPPPTPSPEPTIMPLTDYVALPSGALGVELEFRQVILHYDNLRATVDALQVEPASRWPGRVDVADYRRQVATLAQFLVRAGKVGGLWIDSGEGERVISQLYSDDQDAQKALVDFWKQSWSEYEEAGQQLTVATALADSGEFGRYQSMMDPADGKVEALLTLTLSQVTIQTGD